MREGTLEASPEIPIDYAQHKPLLDNVRLWDWRAFHDTITQLQALRTYYVFADTDVDRYTIDGQYRQVLLAHDVAFEVVCILVSTPIPHPLHERRWRIAQLKRHRQSATSFHVRHGCQERVAVALGCDLVSTSPEEYDAFLKRELATWSKVVKAVGLKID